MKYYLFWATESFIPPMCIAEARTIEEARELIPLWYDYNGSVMELDTIILLGQYETPCVFVNDDIFMHIHRQDFSKKSILVVDIVNFVKDLLQDCKISD
jgi:hypothetical protein